MAKKRSTTTGAGELTEQLTILHRVDVDDGQGGTAVTWPTFAAVWGRMQPLSASELLAAQAVQSTQTYAGTIYTRIPQDITPKMRVRWTPYGYAAPKELEIHGVLPNADEPRRLTDLDVGEIVVV